MVPAKIGDRVAAPVCIVNTKFRATRSRYGYDIGTVVATGRKKKSGKLAVKVKFTTSDSIWVKRITKEPFFERWCLLEEVDKV